MSCPEQSSSSSSSSSFFYFVSFVFKSIGSVWRDHRSLCEDRERCGRRPWKCLSIHCVNQWDTSGERCKHFMETNQSTSNRCRISVSGCVWTTATGCCSSLRIIYNEKRGLVMWLKWIFYTTLLSCNDRCKVYLNISWSACTVCEVFSVCEWLQEYSVSWVSSCVQFCECILSNLRMCDSVWSRVSRRVHAEEKVIASCLIPPSISPYRSSIRQRKKGGWCEESFVSHVEMLLIGFSLAAEEVGSDEQLERVKEKLNGFI